MAVWSIETDGVAFSLAAYSVEVAGESGTGAFGSEVVLTLRSGKRRAAMLADRAAIAEKLAAAIKIELEVSGRRLLVAFAPKPTDLDRDDGGIVLRFTRTGNWHEDATSVLLGGCLTSLNVTSSLLVQTNVGVSQLTGPTAAITALVVDGVGRVACAAGVNVWQMVNTALVARGACASSVAALAISPAGVLYAAGAFGVNVWTAGAWVALGSIGATVTALRFDAAGELNAGCAASIYVRRWNGSSWLLIGALAFAPVRLLLGPDGLVYALGTGVYRLVAGAWVSVGGPAAILDGCFLPDGRLLVAYATGVQSWNGAAWVSVGVTTAAAVASLTSQAMIAGTLAASTSVADTLILARGVLFPGEIDIARAIVALGGAGDVLYIGLGGSGATVAYFPMAYSRALPAGSPEIVPTLRLTYSGILTSVYFVSVAVVRSGAVVGALYFDNLSVALGETVTIGASGAITSSVRGDLAYTLRAGSSPLLLGPGANTIVLNGDGALTATLLYEAAVISADTFLPGVL